MGKWIVCSAWPYINGMPHLGTMLHLITADFYARFLTQMGEDVISISGSDEHGTPIEVAAIKEGITPKELTDKNHLKLLEVLSKYQIHLSNYSRTENPVHISFVKEFYSNLEQRGYISRKSTVQLYCEHDKIFLPDRFLEGTCPFCGYDKAKGDQCDSCGRLLEPTSLIGPRCVLCGSAAVQRTTEHWYFDLPRFSEELKEYVITMKDLDDSVKNTT
ncbi:MAG: class I tRNA ligase family protein, partial [Nitrososphaerota archaeon]|nr:class I tRNA ligase family protein [Nitrososphaerota archaeon]